MWDHPRPSAVEAEIRGSSVGTLHRGFWRRKGQMCRSRRSTGDLVLPGFVKTAQWSEQLLGKGGKADWEPLPYSPSLLMEHASSFFPEFVFHKIPGTYKICSFLYPTPESGFNVFNNTIQMVR
jgi:hypothetical protein